MSKGDINSAGGVALNPDGKVCVLGLGYVGLTLAVAMADVGFEVHGVEIRESVLLDLNDGRSHFYEPGLNEKIRRLSEIRRFTWSSSIPESWDGTVFIVTVGTPLDQNGASRVDMVENAARQVAQSLKPRDLVIMRSTVKLGVTRNNVVPILNARKVDYDIAFCPERTLEGNALSELRALPQIVGGKDYRSGVRAMRIFNFLTPTVIRVSGLETAEMIKLVDNAQRDVFFAYANEIARACDAAGISAKEVIQSGKIGYSRTNLPMPGPVGGPCLEKDSHILLEGLAEHKCDLPITRAARILNEQQPREVIQKLKELTAPIFDGDRHLKISLLGLAFKGVPETDDLRGTMARPILAALRESFPTANFYGFDPVVKAPAIYEFGLNPAKTLQEAFSSADLVLILNNHSTLKHMPLDNLSALARRPSVIYDFWNHYDIETLHLPSGVFYISLGSHCKVDLGPYSLSKKPK